MAVWKAPPDFHALHSAVRKRYIYLLFNKSIPSVFNSKLVYWYPHSINFRQLQAMSQVIQGQHDFKSFQNTGTPVKNSMRTIYFAKWSIFKKNTLCFQIEGEGFLKQMIRNLIGTQLALMHQNLAVQTLKEILAKKDRAAAFKTAPACGLYLHKVYYPSHLDRKCKKI